MSKSTGNQEKVTTTAHLTQTIAMNLSHVDRHMRALKKSVTPKQKEFNYDHAFKHVQETIEHVQKLADHLRDNYPAEGKELKLVETTVPRSYAPSIVLKDK